MRLVFAGTPEFSVAPLEALVAAGHELVGVFTQPDRRAGRGRSLKPSAVAIKAEALGIPVFKPHSFKTDPNAVKQLQQLAPDCMIVVAFGMILPQAVLDIPAHGCLNIHASLLPQWRGAAPIARAVLAGDVESGVTIMRMDAGLDTGPMLLKQATAIHASTTAGELHDELASMGADLIVEAVAALERQALTETPQPSHGESYASKLSKAEARVDWSQTALKIRQHIHGFNPDPGAWTNIDGKRLKLHRATLSDLTTPTPPLAGTILACDRDGLSVACGKGVIRITEVQREGGKAGSPLTVFGGKPPSVQMLT